jgi:hypothetical protein
MANFKDNFNLIWFIHNNLRSNFFLQPNFWLLAEDSWRDLAAVILSLCLPLLLIMQY